MYDPHKDPDLHFIGRIRPEEFEFFTDDNCPGAAFMVSPGTWGDTTARDYQAWCDRYPCITPSPGQLRRMDLARGWREGAAGTIEAYPPATSRQYARFTYEEVVAKAREVVHGRESCLDFVDGEVCCFVTLEGVAEICIDTDPHDCGSGGRRGREAAYVTRVVRDENNQIVSTVPPPPDPSFLLGLWPSTIHICVCDLGVGPGVGVLAGRGFPPSETPDLVRRVTALYEALGRPPVFHGDGLRGGLSDSDRLYVMCNKLLCLGVNLPPDYQPGDATDDGAQWAWEVAVGKREYTVYAGVVVNVDEPYDRDVACFAADPDTAVALTRERIARQKRIAPSTTLESGCRCGSCYETHDLPPEKQRVEAVRLRVDEVHDNVLESECAPWTLWDCVSPKDYPAFVAAAHAAVRSGVYATDAHTQRRP